MPNLDATSLRPFIPARDFELSKRFYAALGWDTRDVGPRLALVTIAAGQQFYLQDFHVPAFTENAMLHVTVADAAAWHAHVAAALEAGPFPTARVQAPRRQDYGAIVTFVHDPSGVLLHLCEWDR